VFVSRFAGMPQFGHVVLTQSDIAVKVILRSGWFVNLQLQVIIPGSDLQEQQLRHFWAMNNRYWFTPIALS
jgi:hypothetical protein